MDFDLILFWILCSSCLTALVMTLLRQRSAAKGWLAVYLAVLVLAIAGWWWNRPAILYAAAALWFVLVGLPGLLWRLYNRRIIQQRFADAHRLARIIGWLHPADGMRELPEIDRAFELAQRGDLTAASDTLNRLQQIRSPLGLGAMAHLYRITGRWEELLIWESQHRGENDRRPELLSSLLRARGETGDLRGLVELYGRHRRQIERRLPKAYRDICRLMLFAFSGKRQAVERLVGGSLAAMPASTRTFWLATADLHAGESESARRQLESLLPGADPVLRGAIGRRLSRISIRLEPPDVAAERLIEDAATELVHEETFDVRRSLFSSRAVATQILIALNVAVFAVEICLGGSSDLEVLYRMGGLFPPAVHAGEWWRLLAATFLHLGPLHLAMNMLGLWFLGPFVEFALGFRRFTVVYLLAGIGSMATVTALSSGAGAETLTVGASGCIMGLVGATGAMMLRGWLRENAAAAKRRLGLVLAIVSMQIMFDALTPHVSMTGHLSGALIGFAAAMVLRDRLTPLAASKS